MTGARLAVLTKFLTLAVFSTALAQAYPPPCQAPLMSMAAAGNCMDLEYAYADSALGAAYRITLARYTDVRRTALSADQRAWLAKRASIKPDSLAGNHPSMLILPTLIAMTRARTFELRHLAFVVDESDAESIPVQAAFRHAIGGPGLVLQLRNTSRERLEITARFYNPATDELKAMTTRINAGGMAEFGRLEGWQFESGHLVQLVHGAFASRLLTAP